jgi:hypothetical protein
MGHHLRDLAVVTLASSLAVGWTQGSQGTIKTTDGRSLSVEKTVVEGRAVVFVIPRAGHALAAEFRACLKTVRPRLEARGLRVVETGAVLIGYGGGGWGTIQLSADGSFLGTLFFAGRRRPELHEGLEAPAQVLERAALFFADTEDDAPPMR